MCLIEGCTKKHEAQGYCKTHYNLLVRQGKLETKTGRGRPRTYTDEERKEIARLKAQKKYYKKKGYEQGECPQKPQRNKHPSYNMWVNAKQRAKERNLPFDLLLEEINIPDTCPMLGIPLQKGVLEYTDNSPTLDRIIPDKGYTQGNVWVISMRANRIKQDASVDELGKIYQALKDKLP